jgi:hypothetical protein
VVVRYLDDNKTTTFMLSTTRDDITNGYLEQRIPCASVNLQSATRWGAYAEK